VNALPPATRGSRAQAVWRGCSGSSRAPSGGHRDPRLGRECSRQHDQPRGRNRGLFTRDGPRVVRLDDGCHRSRWLCTRSCSTGSCCLWCHGCGR